MAAAWVLSRGWAADAAVDTFVPEGVVVRTYRKIDAETLGEGGLVTIASGTIAPETENSGAERIPNYVLGAFGDADAATTLAGSSELSGRVLAVGDALQDGTPLCSDPMTCVSPTHSENCMGLFARVRDTELYLVDFDTSEPDPGNATLGNAYQQHAWDLLAYAEQDPAAMLVQFHSYPMDMQTLLVQSDDRLRAWLKSLNDPAATAAEAADDDPADQWIDQDYRLWMTSAELPASVEELFKNEYWDHIFRTWYEVAGRASGPQLALITLYGTMQTYYSLKSEENLREVTAVCNGERGDVPASDSGDREVLTLALEAREEHGGLQSETPDQDAAIIAEALQRVFDGVVAQLEAIYPEFARDVNHIKGR